MNVKVAYLLCNFIHYYIFSHYLRGSTTKYQSEPGHILFINTINYFILIKDVYNLLLNYKGV